MAEAHQAVAFPFVITNDRWNVNVDREVLKLVWRSGLRSWKRQLARFMVCIIFIQCRAKVKKLLYLFEKIASKMILEQSVIEGVDFIRSEDIQEDSTEHDKDLNVSTNEIDYKNKINFLEGYIAQVEGEIQTKFSIYIGTDKQSETEPSNTPNRIITGEKSNEKLHKTQQVKQIIILHAATSKAAENCSQKGAIPVVDRQPNIRADIQNPTDNADSKNKRKQLKNTIEGTKDGGNIMYTRSKMHWIFVSRFRNDFDNDNMEQMVWNEFGNEVKCSIEKITKESYLTKEKDVLFHIFMIPKLILIFLFAFHYFRTDSKWKFVDGAIVALFIWLSVVYLIRYTLKLLFMYKGWMYEARGKSISTKTKAWIALVRILSSFNKPKLFSLQGSLPKLPLPSLRSTIERYMQSVRPLKDYENYERIKNMSESFEKGIGPKLQRYLILKSWWSTNYVADWWEEYVYLRARSPLIINSNFYGMDALVRHPTKSQAARAASVINGFFMFKRLIERQELKPLLIQNAIPLCSSQYERAFNTTRIPGLETDQIVHWKDSNHVAIYYRGRYYKVIVKTNKILNAREIQDQCMYVIRQIQQIIDDPYEPLPAEAKLGALTASNRTEWAQIRRSFFNTGVNRNSLDAIEKAAFFVSLDDVPYMSNPEIPEELDAYGKLLLHGNGYNRWFDKSITLCVSSNGKTGVNCEHSW
ncbi:carnitine o-acyltransferase [Holotrichia oblita]|uniref:Carnitine o-acyltransferase n=1 Tax=Holotrichia oblita TaxID=644536 RepID=A0ACB9TVD6_HOLOL|nr:carnitine o-acyltransferase [Holotrichia oblita]